MKHLWSGVAVAWRCFAGRHSLGASAAEPVRRGQSSGTARRRGSRRRAERDCEHAGSRGPGPGGRCSRRDGDEPLGSRVARGQ